MIHARVNGRCVEQWSSGHVLRAAADVLRTGADKALLHLEDVCGAERLNFAADVLLAKKLQHTFLTLDTCLLVFEGAVSTSVAEVSSPMILSPTTTSGVQAWIRIQTRNSGIFGILGRWFLASQGSSLVLFYSCTDFESISRNFRLNFWHHIAVDEQRGVVFFDGDEIAINGLLRVPHRFSVTCPFETKLLIDRNSNFFHIGLVFPIPGILAEPVELLDLRFGSVARGNLGFAISGGHLHPNMPPRCSGHKLLETLSADGTICVPVIQVPLPNLPSPRNRPTIDSADLANFEHLTDPVKLQLSRFTKVTTGHVWKPSIVFHREAADVDDVGSVNLLEDEQATGRLQVKSSWKTWIILILVFAALAWCAWIAWKWKQRRNAGEA
jgi:hypothetical protein